MAVHQQSQVLGFTVAMYLVIPWFAEQIRRREE